MAASLLPPPVEAVRAAAREYADGRVRPCVEEHERGHRFPRALIQEMGQLGFFASAFPKTVGGAEAGFLAHAAICEEFSRTWSSLRAPFNMRAMTCPMTILRCGSDAQRGRFVRPLITGELIGLFALTSRILGRTWRGSRTPRSSMSAWCSPRPIRAPGMMA